MRRRALRCLVSSSPSSSSLLLLSLLPAPSALDRLGARSIAASVPIAQIAAARYLWSASVMAAAVAVAKAAPAATTTTAIGRAAATTLLLRARPLLLPCRLPARSSSSTSPRPLSTSAPRAAESDAPTKALPPQRHLPELPQLPAPVTLRPLTRADVAVAFSRSSGAGGQNVNKVSTKVDMRWDVGLADWVPEQVKGALKHMEKNRFTGGRAKPGSDDDGSGEGGGGGSGGGGASSSSAVIVVSASRHRTQRANLDDALERLQAMLDAAVAAVTPRESDPEAVKRVAKAVKAGNEKRLDAKKKDAKKKSERRKKGDWD